MIAGVQKIGLASDHAGYYIKIAVRDFLAKWAPEVELIDYGTGSGSESCDYPDFAHKLGDALDRGEVDMGVGVCGSGEGIQMALNKHRSVRAGLAWMPEIASLIRQHNNANVLVLPGRFVPVQEAQEMAEIFFSTDFEGGRHERRVRKIATDYGETLS